MLNRARSIVKNVVAFGIGLILMLILFELILQIYNPLETRLRGDNIVLPVEKRYVFKNPGIPGLDSKITHTKNALGFRGPPLPAGGLDGYMSIVTVGGSTTECFYLSDGKTWPDLLAAKLQGEWHRFWLNNAGLDGHSTFGHLVLLRDFVLSLKPKIVMFLVGLNDVNNTSLTVDHTAATLKGPILWSSLQGFIKSSAYYSEVMSVALNLFRYAYAWEHGIAHQPVNLRTVKQLVYPEAELPVLMDEQRRVYLPAYEKRLRSLIELTRESGAEPIFVTQPMLYGEGVDPATGVDLAGVATSIVGPYSGYSAWAIVELYNNVTRQVGLSEGVAVVDLAAELPKDSRLFYDYSHYTNEGAAQVADIIYRHVSPVLKERFGQTKGPLVNDMPVQIE